MPRNYIKNVEIEDAHIFWRNFSGRPGEYNTEGARNFCVTIPEDMVDELIEEGWNVKQSKSVEEGYEPDHYMKVNVRYGRVSPIVYKMTRSRRVPLDEDTIGTLDDAEIERVDLIIRPYEYKPGNVSAYLKEMYVTVVQSRFAEKYDDMYNDPEDVPFE